MSTRSKMTQKTLTQLEKITGGKLTLGRLLWALRKCDEVNQVDFARKLEISRQHLCDIEHNRKIVSPSLAGEYANKLGYSAEQFIRISLQDMLDRDGLDLTVEVRLNRKKRGGGLGKTAYAQ